MSDYSKGETGITSLAKARLKAELTSLSHENEKIGSLIIDEMAIKPQLQYDRNLDMFLGVSDIEVDALGISDKLANKLLCFLFRGLSTFYRIPVSFYFTDSIGGKDLGETLEAVSVLEETGFKVIRVSTDNHKSNVSLFELLNSDGQGLKHEIKHPLDLNRPLNLSINGHEIKQETECEGCLREISVPKNDSPLLSLTKHRDRGGLHYANALYLLGYF